MNMEMNMEMNLFPMSQRDQGPPPKSVWIKSFINELFDGPPRGLVVLTYPPIWLFTTTFENQVGSSHVQATQFDSDSQTLMVDDRASACITND